jgi:site-specific DNA-methyltransferase (adenine-specific)
MTVKIITGCCLDIMEMMEDKSIQACVTSPPYYGLRDYGVEGQIGLEETPEAYVNNLVRVFREVRRVLRDDGTLWLNLGDSYASQGGAHGGRNDNQRGVGAKRLHAEGVGDQAARRPAHGYKQKDLLGIPWMVAFALRADGWYLRSAIVWHKPNPMPESVRDRPTSAYENVFLLSKREKYFYDADAIAEPLACPDAADGSRIFGGKQGPRNAAHGERTNGRAYTKTPEAGRNVWTIATQPFTGAHFATMPPELAERCIKASSKPGDTILDPFGGAGTTGLVADRLARNAILCELNPEYVKIARERIINDAPLFSQQA